LSERERFARAYFDFLGDEVFGMSKRHMLKHYPGLKAACNADFKKADFSAKDTATFAARSIIVDLIAKAGSVRRERVLLQYNEINWDAFYVWYLNSRIRPEPPPKDLDSLTILIARAQCAIMLANRLGDVDDIALDDFTRDIAGALEGLSEAERIHERTRSTLENLIQDLGMDPEKFRPPM
jgi:hypothetical protein